MLDKYKHEVFTVEIEYLNGDKSTPRITAFNGDAEIDPSEVEYLISQGILTEQKITTRYWTNAEGSKLWREKQRQDEIARLEAKLAKLRSQEE